MSKILRILIPKTACCSRNYVVMRYTKVGLPFDAGSDLNPGAWDINRPYNKDRDRFMSELYPLWNWELVSDKKIVGWHTPVHLFDNAPYEWTKITFVRDPYENMLSAYFFFRNYAQYRNLSFEEFYSLPHFVNHQTHYLRSLDEFEFVGIYEHIKEDFIKSCEIMNIPWRQLPHENNGVKSKERDDLSGSGYHRDQFSSIYVEDMELYENALRRRVN